MTKRAQIRSSVLEVVMLTVGVIAGCYATHFVLSEVPRDALRWVVFALAAWLGIGVLTAQLFGGFVSGSQHSWEQD
jgi:hypothetical protein